MVLWGRWGFYSYMIFFSIRFLQYAHRQVLSLRASHSLWFPEALMWTISLFLLINSRNQGEGDRSRPQITSVDVHLSGTIENEGYGISAFRAAVVIEERWRAIRRSKSGGHPYIGLVPRREIVGEGIKKHFSDHLSSEILKNEGFQDSGLYRLPQWAVESDRNLDYRYYKCAKRVDDLVNEQSNGKANSSYIPYTFSMTSNTMTRMHDCRSVVVGCSKSRHCPEADLPVWKLVASRSIVRYEQNKE